MLAFWCWCPPSDRIVLRPSSGHDVQWDVMSCLGSSFSRASSLLQVFFKIFFYLCNCAWMHGQHGVKTFLRGFLLSLWLNNALCIHDQVIYIHCDSTPPSRPPGHHQLALNPALAPFPWALWDALPPFLILQFEFQPTYLSSCQMRWFLSPFRSLKCQKLWSFNMGMVTGNTQLVDQDWSTVLIYIFSTFLTKTTVLPACFE